MVTTRNEPAAVAPEEPRSGRTRWTPSERQRELIAWAIVGAILLLPIRGMMRNPGPPMEEGFMLVAPDRLLHGWIPNRDFLHLYGPGSIWVLAAVYKVFGTDLFVERFFGVLQQIGVAFGMYAIARWWGRRVAVVSAVLMIVIMLPPAVLTAFAWTGSIALGLIGIAVGMHARATPDDRRGFRLAVVAGILFGVAFLYRLDVVFALVMAVAVLAWGAPRRRAKALVVSFVASSAVVLVHFVMAGFGNAFRGMVLDPVFKLRPGRRLPIPPGWNHFDGFPQIVGSQRRLPSWPLPMVGQPKQLFFWFFLNLFAIAFVIGVGLWAVRRDRTSIRARGLLAGALFALGIVSQSLQRADSTHVAWVSCVSLSLVPLAMMEVLGVWRSRGGVRANLGRHARLLSCLVPLLVVLVVLPDFSFRGYADYAALTFGHNRESYVIRRGDRIFYYGEGTSAAGANDLVAAAEQYVRPGDRLFVGPTDLRRTVTSEDWWYYLYPELTPATYFIELDPGIANEKGSRLAPDLETADMVILSNVWNEFEEPNEGTKLGDPAPNRVLKRDFCKVGDYGEVPEFLQERVRSAHWWELWVRCNRLNR